MPFKTALEFRTEIIRERKTIQIAAPIALERPQIQHQKQDNQQHHCYRHRHNKRNQAPLRREHLVAGSDNILISERHTVTRLGISHSGADTLQMSHVRQKRYRQQGSHTEAENVRVVVNTREQSEQETDGQKEG